MNTYTMKCSCGDVMTKEAADRASAVAQFKDMMTEEMISSHFAEKHAGGAVPAVADVHAMIEANVEPKE